MKITLCGSTRFADQYVAWNKYLTLSNHIVYSLGYWPPDPRPKESEKVILDLVHLAKIEESDAILVIDCKRFPHEKHDPSITPYTGESTEKEMRWTVIREKKVFFTSHAASNVELGFA